MRANSRVAKGKDGEYDIIGSDSESESVKNVYSEVELPYMRCHDAREAFLLSNGEIARCLSRLTVFGTPPQF